MKNEISIDDKQRFLKWFLQNYRLKNRESTWILKYLINHKEILQYVYFVRKVEKCPRSMIISARCSDEISFRFSKKHLHTTDAEKAFHDLRLNQKESLYIQLNFSGARRTPRYVGVLQENPYLPEHLNEKDKKIASHLLEELTYSFNKAFIQKKIDEMLDSENSKGFLKWSMELRRLDEGFLYRPTLKE